MAFLQNGISSNYTEMISTYEISKFKEKLNELTKSGYPLLKGNPLGVFFSLNFSPKPFYGYVYESEFKITKNTNINVIPYLIVGKFKKKAKFTEVTYQIIPMKFGYYWIRIIPLLFNIIGIIALAINYSSIDFENFNYTTGLLFFLLCEFFLLLPLLITYISKKKFEKKFLKELKIQNN